MGIERIRHYVLDCNIRRLAAEETAECLRENGLPVSVRTVTTAEVTEAFLKVNFLSLCLAMFI